MDRSDSRAQIDGIARGDRKVFLSFYNRVSIPFLKYIYYRVGGDMDLARDIFQEAFSRMVKSRESLRKLHGDEVLFPWLCGVARRILADRFREHSRRRAISLDALDPSVQEALLHIESKEVPEETARHPQMQLLIGMTLSALNPSHAEVLKAKYCEGKSVQQIAQHSRASEKTIEGRLFRAREAFRAVFKKVRQEIEAVHVA